MQNRSQKLEDFPLVRNGHANFGERRLSLREILDVVHPLNQTVASLTQEGVAFPRGQPQVLSLCSGNSSAQLIEDVIVPLIFSLWENVKTGLKTTTQSKQSITWSHLKNDTWSFQKICPDGRSSDFVVLVEVNFDVLAKPGRVVVANCLGIAKGLHDRIRGHNLFLYLAHLWVRVVHTRKVSHHVFGAVRKFGCNQYERIFSSRWSGPSFSPHSLSRATLTSDDDGLILPLRD